MKGDGSRSSGNGLKTNDISFALFYPALNLHGVLFSSQYDNLGGFLYWQPEHKRYREIHGPSLV